VAESGIAPVLNFKYQELISDAKQANRFPHGILGSNPNPGEFYLWDYKPECGSMTFKAYMKNIQTKTGKTPDEFWKLANKKGFVKRGKVVAKHADMMDWLKSSQIGLGHVHASFMIMYLRLRAKDPKVSTRMKKWAYSTGYKKWTK
jgi:hypothetical protein